MTVSMITDLLVAGFPTGLSGDDPGAKGFLYKTAYEYVLKQFDGQWPIPVITFMSQDYVVTNDPETMREFYAGMDHACESCAEGLQVAVNAIKTGKAKVVALIKIDYTTEWAA